MGRCVVDASALLASEPGADLVAAQLPGAIVCSVNLAEVASKLVDGGLPPDAVAEALDGLAVDVRAFDHALALAAGLLRARTRSLGLSLGDRACLALAEQLSLPVLTADRAWRRLKLRIEVRTIR